MSWITDVLVHVDYAPHGAHKALEGDFHAGVYSSGNPRIERLMEVPLSKGDVHNHGGGKVFTGTVYAGSYNHLDADSFLRWFKGLPWGSYSHAVLSMVGESQFYSIYRLRGSELIEVDAWSDVESA